MKKLIAATAATIALLSVSASAHSFSLTDFLALFSNDTGCSGGKNRNNCFAA
jgi:hypothetical protein